jgi:hypothetical protein
VDPSRSRRETQHDERINRIQCARTDFASERDRVVPKTAPPVTFGRDRCGPRTLGDVVRVTKFKVTLSRGQEAEIRDEDP